MRIRKVSKTLTVRMPEDLRRELDEYAKESMLGPTDIARIAIYAYLHGKIRQQDEHKGFDKGAEGELS